MAPSASERLRGSVSVEIECAYPERLLNECAGRGIVFRDVVRNSAISFTASVSARDCCGLRALARSRDISVTAGRVSGAPALLRILRRRWLPVLMLAAVFLALRASSLFVWEIDVYGNEGTPARAILGALRELGFGYGTFVPSVVSEELSDKIILELPQLQWFAVNIRGSHADVLVRERVDRPELTDARAAEAVCASKGGLIVKMSVLAGEPARSVGDTVTAGDVLVSGATRGGTTSASAEVWARTWYELTARLPDMYVKRYTGNVKYRRYAVFGGGKIKLSVNSGISWANYDKIITERKLRLPLGGVLPITVVTERYEEYTLPRAADMAADAEETLRRALMSRLDGLVGDGEIRAAVFETSEADGVSVMTLRAECVEQIAVRRPMAAPERADMPGQS